MAFFDNSFDWYEFYVRDDRTKRQYFDAVEFQREDNRERQRYREDNPRGSIELARLPTESSYWVGDGDAADAQNEQDPFDDDMSRIRRYPTFRLFRSDIRDNDWF